MKLYRIPPVGERIPLRGVFMRADINSYFNFPEYNFYFYDSGTASLAAALLSIKKKNPARDKVIIPAYCCPDIVSAIHYVGLRPVLIDFDPDSSFIDLDFLHQKISEDALAVVAINFSGIKERISQIKEIIESKGIALIEDSAQLSPWRTGANMLADYVVLSFGRGKPESVLLGGALFSKNSDIENENILSNSCSGTDSVLDKLRYFIKVSIYNMALSPFLYKIIASIPFLHVGETRYKKLNKICGMPEFAKNMLAAKLAQRQTNIRIQTIYSDYFNNEPTIVNLPITSNADLNALLRYPILLPNKAVKQHLIVNNSHLGVSEMYPSVLYEIPGLDDLKTDENYVNAKSFAERVATLPVHSGISPEIAKEIVAAIDKSVRNAGL